MAHRPRCKLIHPAGRTHLLLLACSIKVMLAIMTQAQEPATPPASNPPLQEIRPGLFKLGDQVELNKTNRTVQFPAAVNLTESPVEYLLVSSYGKIHESVLRTEVRPHEIHMAMLLLGAKGAGTNALPEDPASELPGDPLDIEITWTGPDGSVIRTGEELVLDRARDKAMSTGPWRYTGSMLFHGTFLAEQEGSIISLITDPAALVNNPRTGRENDDNWLPLAKNLPPEETVVVVRLKLKPAQSRKESPPTTP